MTLERNSHSTCFLTCWGAPVAGIVCGGCGGASWWGLELGIYTLSLEKESHSRKKLGFLE